VDGDNPLTLAKTDADGFIEAEVVGGLATPDRGGVLEGRPRYPGQMYSKGYEFHECIPSRYIDDADGVVGVHCPMCGYVWTYEPYKRAPQLQAERKALNWPKK